MGRGSWVVGHGSWIVGRGSWVVGHGSWVMGHGSWVMGRGSWVMGHGSWVVGRGSLSCIQQQRFTSTLFILVNERLLIFCIIVLVVQLLPRLFCLNLSFFEIRIIYLMLVVG
jgi:hypothetical protein